MKFFYILLTVTLIVPLSAAQTIIFADDFEGSIRPEWFNYLSGFRAISILSQHGNFAAFTDQRNRYLSYDVGLQAQDLTFEGWFRDTPAANPFEFSAGISALDSQAIVAVGVETLADSSHYLYRLDGLNWVSTNIDRTLGWHLWQIYVGVDSLGLLIDGQAVYEQNTGNESARFFSMHSDGESSQNPGFPYFFDNVKLYEGRPVPEPATFCILGLGVLAFFQRRK